MATTFTQRKLARIHFQDGQVVVTPEDQDVFILGAEKAIKACKEAIHSDQMLEHFRTTLLKPLSVWAGARSEKVAALYLAQTDSSHITAYVVGKSEEYDFALAAELAELDLSFWDHGWPISIHLIPNAEDVEILCNFFDPERALQIYG